MAEIFQKLALCDGRIVSGVVLFVQMAFESAVYVDLVRVDNSATFFPSGGDF